MGVGGVVDDGAVASTSDVVDLAHQLPDVSHTDHDSYSRLQVAGRTFGYLWEPTRTVGLRQTLAEQLALVAERPEVFEVQFTAGGFGWVVAHLHHVARDELAELVFEAWRLTAPAVLVAERDDQLPS
ncbi:MAG: MmcQ/YjbR family DNA-binding protein [Rhodoferax sp.]|nr:MmcQ/YjbR family DNA-binding protein [Actinomycetota bacterium]